MNWRISKGGLEECVRFRQRRGEKYSWENEEKVSTGTEMGMGMANAGGIKESNRDMKERTVAGIIEVAPWGHGGHSGPGIRVPECPEILSWLCTYYLGGLGQVT